MGGIRVVLDFFVARDHGFQVRRQGAARGDEVEVSDEKGQH